MTTEYGLKEYKDLLEVELKRMNDTFAPIEMGKDEAYAWAEGVRSTILWCLEMLPEKLE